MSNMTHHELCLLAAEWLHRKHKKGNIEGTELFLPPCCKWVAVELVCVGGPCIPDVFGWGDGIGIGFAGVQIEVKMSRADFLRDRKKQNFSNPAADVGLLKYYCCPDGVIDVDDLPDWCGLLYERRGTIEVIRHARTRPDKTPAYEVPLIASVMRRLDIKPGILDFKKKINEKSQETNDYSRHPDVRLFVLGAEGSSRDEQ